MDKIMVIGEASLSDLREEINEIDTSLILLLKKRFDISKDIGKYKIENNLPIENKEREKEIIASIVETSGLDEDFISDVFNLIFKESKRLQVELKLK